MGIVKGIFASNISGKVGNVVFRKNGKANVVSQRPANVKNPRSDLQQMQRAYIKSVASAYSVLRKICDHSFEGVPYGALSMNYFNKVNYPVVSSAKVAVLKNSSNVMVPVGLAISKGSIIWNGYFEENSTFADISKYMAANNITDIAEVTFSQLLEALGLKNGDQITIINVVSTELEFKSPNGLISQFANEMYYARYILYSAELATKAFVKVGGETATSYKINPAILAEDSLMSTKAEIVVLNKGSLQVRTDKDESSECYAAIISRRDGDKWLRSNAYLISVNSGDESYNISNVLSSYMPSDEPYLNNAEK